LRYAHRKHRLKEFPRFLCGSLGCKMYQLQLKYRSLPGRSEKFSGLVDAAEASYTSGSQFNLREMPS
jgi:hypothetical protein